MIDPHSKLRVLYSFPNRLGAGRICWTAWQQVIGLEAAGIDVTAIVGCLAKRPPAAVKTITTLALGRVRMPYRILGVERTLRIHDWITSMWLKANHQKIDLVHAWPLGAFHTIKVARNVGIPVVLERPNCHTRFAYQAVEDECKSLNVTLPKGYEHTFNAGLLAYENLEYASADFLLCPSDFVKKTFIDEGFSEAKLLRHRYGYDNTLISSGNQSPLSNKGLVMLYAGLGSPRKGLHHALTAWLASDASKTGRFLICGDIVEAYRQKLEAMLAHPSVEILGHRSDLGELMKRSDLFVLSSVEEGSALVTYEARGAGCVLLVSDAAGAVCRHLENGLIHQTGDVRTLTSHLDLLNQDRPLLARLRKQSVDEIESLSWSAAGTHLKDVYLEAVRLHTLNERGH